MSAVACPPNVMATLFDAFRRRQSAPAAAVEGPACRTDGLLDLRRRQAGQRNKRRRVRRILDRQHLAAPHGDVEPVEDVDQPTITAAVGLAERARLDHRRLRVPNLSIDEGLLERAKKVSGK